MAKNRSLYKYQPSFVLGFHGTEASVVNKVVSRSSKHLTASEGKYEWLGHGIYFWENDPQRAIEWATDGNSKKKIKEPSTVGAIIDLGLCLDLTTRSGLDEVKLAHEMLCDFYAQSCKELPQNNGGKYLLRRELDCQVIQALHIYRENNKLPKYDSVRSPFIEDEPLYLGAGFNSKNHIQIAIRSISCIKVYFHPIEA